MMSVRDTAFGPCSDVVMTNLRHPRGRGLIPAPRIASFHTPRGARKEALHTGPGEIKFFKKALVSEGVVHSSGCELLR